MANVIEKVRNYDAVVTERDAALARITNLEARNPAADFEAAITEANKLNETLTAAVNKASSELTAANNRVAELEASAAKTDEKVEARASILAQQQLASVGVPPVAAVPSATPQGGATKMPRADFTKLSPTMQMSFIKSGGQLTE